MRGRAPVTCISAEPASADEARKWLKCAEKAVWIHVHENARPWAQDIAAEVALYCVEGHAKGIRKFSRKMYRWMVLLAMRRMVGDERHVPTWTTAVYDEIPADSHAPNELGGLCMRRLQEVWPTLSDAQQAGLYSVIVDGKYSTGIAARLFGVEMNAVQLARTTALRRLDNPRAFKSSGREGAERAAKRIARQRAAKEAA